MFPTIRARLAADMRRTLATHDAVLTLPDETTVSGLRVIVHRNRMDRDTYREKYLNQAQTTVTVFRSDVAAVPPRGSFLTLTPGDEVFYLESPQDIDETKMIFAVTANGGA